MFRLTAVAVSMLVVGCASMGTHGDSVQRPESAGAGQVPLVSSNKVSPGTVRYDAAKGTCSTGIQLLGKVEYDALVSEWNAPANCTAPSKSRVPSKASYPNTFGKLRTSGSAQVLVRLQPDGTVASARAVCATDRDFAAAAEATAKAISFSPAKCNGVPARSTFLLPLDYQR